MNHPNWERAIRSRGAVQWEEEIHLFPGDEDPRWLVVRPVGSGGRLGSGFFGLSTDEVAKALENAPTSARPDAIFRLRRDPAGGPGEWYLRPFFAALREESQEGLERAARWINPRVALARAFWADRNTLVAEYHDKLGLVIGRGGANVRPLQTAMARHGLRLVVRLTCEAEAEKRRRDERFEAAAAQQRAEAEASRPAREAEEARQAREAKRRFLQNKKELLERKLEEQEGTGREDRILELILKVEADIAAL